MSKTKEGARRETLGTSEVLDLPPFNSMVEHNGREYFAVGIHLDIIGMRGVPYVAMVVVEKGVRIAKRIEIDEAAHRFFERQGLPTTVAEALVALAVALRDEKK